MQSKILAKADLAYFKKAVQTYYFFKQQLNSDANPILKEHLEKGCNLSYSLFLDFFKKGKLELGFLQDINNLLSDIHHLSAEEKEVLFIKPHEIGDIELQELVPMQFIDDETNEVLQILFNNKENAVIWKIKNEEAE